MVLTNQKFYTANGDHTVSPAQQNAFLSSLLNCIACLLHLMHFGVSLARGLPLLHRSDARLCRPQAKRARVSIHGYIADCLNAVSLYHSSNNACLAVVSLVSNIIREDNRLFFGVIPICKNCPCITFASDSTSLRARTCISRRWWWW